MLADVAHSVREDVDVVIDDAFVGNVLFGFVEVVVLGEVSALSVYPLHDLLDVVIGVALILDHFDFEASHFIVNVVDVRGLHLLAHIAFGVGLIAHVNDEFAQRFVIELLLRVENELKVLRLLTD